MENRRLRSLEVTDAFAKEMMWIAPAIIPPLPDATLLM